MPDAGRVITGTAGGRRLRAPGSGTRPLSDKVKQALFSMLEAERGDAWDRPMLDLFAGSGAAGIEALSRGAPQAVFVERHARAASVIAANLERTRLADRGRIIRADAAAFLATDPAGSTDRRFGVVVVDPPYDATPQLVRCLERLGEATAAWLDADAVVVAKHFWKDEPPERVGALVRTRVRRFGETALSVYRRMPTPLAGGS